VNEKRIGSKMYQKLFEAPETGFRVWIDYYAGGRTKVFLNLLRTSGEEDVSNHEMEILHTFYPF